MPQDLEQTDHTEEQIDHTEANIFRVCEEDWCPTGAQQQHIAIWLVTKYLHDLACTKHHSNVAWQNASHGNMAC
eukprot:15475273-Alexandrium_andersonii.AAC.1